MDKLYYQKSKSEFPLPHWFKETSLQSLPCWIVAHFEKRILQCFLEGESEYNSEMPVQNIENYQLIWKQLDDNAKNELIEKTVDELDHFKKESMSSVNLDPNMRLHKNRKPTSNSISTKGSEVITRMNWNEIIFKVVWNLNEDVQRYETLSHNDLKDNMIRKIKYNWNNTVSSFIQTCVSTNLAEAMKLEKFLMNMMVRHLHDLFIQKRIKEIELEDSKKEDKKIKKKKTGKNRKRFKKKKTCSYRFNSNTK